MVKATAHTVYVHTHRVHPLNLVGEVGTSSVYLGIHGTRLLGVRFVELGPVESFGSFRRVK